MSKVHGVVFAAASITLMACSPDAKNPTPGTSTLSAPATVPTSTASPVDQAKRDALAAYRAMWTDFVAAGTTSDWQSPKLSHNATGTALTNLSRGLFSDYQKGWVTKGQPVLNPNVSTVEPADAPRKIIVADCGDSTSWLKYRKDTDQLADDKPGGRQRINAIVERQVDGSWKVSDYGVHEVGSC